MLLAASPGWARELGKVLPLGSLGPLSLLSSNGVYSWDLEHMEETGI